MEVSYYDIQAQENYDKHIICVYSKILKEIIHLHCFFLYIYTYLLIYIYVCMYVLKSDNL